MTDRDRIYLAACALPPSVERDVILDGCVSAERRSLLCPADGQFFRDRDSHIVNFCVDPTVHT